MYLEVETVSGWVFSMIQQTLFNSTGSVQPASPCVTHLFSIAISIYAPLDSTTTDAISY